MSTQAENEVLNEAMSELSEQAQGEPTLADEPLSQPVTTEITRSGGTDEKEEPTPEVEPLDDSLFEQPKEEAEIKPQVTEEQRKLDRERVKQATIENAIKKTVTDGAIDGEKFAQLPEWVQKEINLQFSEPSTTETVDAKAAAREVLEEERDQGRFKDLKQELNGKLTKPQQEALAAKFHRFSKLGMKRGEALQEAMEGIGFGTQDAISKAKQIGFQRGQAAFPVNAQAPGHQTSPESKEVSDMSADEVISMVKGWN